MIETTIAYDNQARLVYIEGPECCSNCQRSLTTRSPDRKETGVQPSTNAELNLYVYESDDDGHGGGLCEGCKADEEQAPLWLMLAKWQAEADERIIYSARAEVHLYERGHHVAALPAPGGILSASDVYAVTKEAPTNSGPAFDLFAGDLHAATMEMARSLNGYTRADSDADELAAATSFALSGKFDATPEDDCPKTERNDR